MFFIEHEANPVAFASIPIAMWWGVMTLTTVGYGDVYPVTYLGKFLGAILAFLGIGIFAIPAGIISSGFSEEVQRKRQQKVSAKLPPTNGNSLPEKRPEYSERVNSPINPEVIAYIEASTDLMKLCIETSQKKFGDAFNNEEIVRDLALSLYQETVRKFDLN